MELLILKIVALARPLASVGYAEHLFVVFGVGLFAGLVVAFLMRTAIGEPLRISGIDAMIAAFTVWCVATSIVYYNDVRVGEVAKLLIPLLSYTVVKNIVPGVQQYVRLLFWIIVGFAVPTLLSAVLIAAGSTSALDMVNYWTQVPRWKGIYNHSHILGHSMTLLLMTIVLYTGLRSTTEYRPTRKLENAFLVLLAMAALYCSYMSQVRSALLGLLIFLLLYGMSYRRKLLIFGTVALAALALATIPYWFDALFYEFAMVKRQGSGDDMMLEFGSGRPRIWLNDIMVVAERPLDEVLAGAGIGNRGETGGEVVYGHNDWLEMLTHTGVVGFGLFAFLQLLIFRRILTLSGKARHMFMALSLAVVVMMAVSNSYIWRIQVSHLYWIILAFIEIPGARRVEEKYSPGHRAAVVETS